MSVKSIFEFKFSADTIAEGLPIAIAIGNDMPPYDGYLDHEVIRDVADPNHLMVSTHWNSRQQAEAVLAKYKDDVKVKRASELIKDRPKGFVGEVLSKSY